METEFRKAILPADLKRLVAFDQKVFQKADWFPKVAWRGYESYWMVVDRVKVGCCAFQHHIDFPDAPRSGSLYILTTGILPRFQGKGLGRLLKSWQIAYARRHGFTRIVTNHRASNLRMIELNKKFGFKIVHRRKGDYYQDPSEPTVVMELRLRKASRGRSISPGKA